MEDNEYNDKLAYYMEIGVIEMAGVDENGEIIFAINDSAQELAPELWESHTEYIEKTLMELYNQDYIEVEYDENLEATITLSEEGKRIAREKGILTEMPDADNNN
jgi:hypothetical protein